MDTAAVGAGRSDAVSRAAAIREIATLRDGLLRRERATCASDPVRTLARGDGRADVVLAASGRRPSKRRCQAAGREPIGCHACRTGHEFRRYSSTWDFQYYRGGFLAPSSCRTRQRRNLSRAVSSCCRTLSRARLEPASARSRGKLHQDSGDARARDISLMVSGPAWPIA